MLSEARTTPAALAHLSEFGPDAAQVAGTAIAIWGQVDTALSSIIGQRGMAALYKRSLFLTRAAHPCLMAAYDGTLTPGDFSALQTALTACSSADATAAASALLRTFHDLLSQLIGASLTERLIGFIWHHPSNGTAVQDTPQ